MLLILPLIRQFDDGGCCAELGSAASRTKMARALRRTLGTYGIDRRSQRLQAMRHQARQVDRAVFGERRRESDGETEAVGAKRHLCFLPDCSRQHSKKKAGRLSAPPPPRPSSD